MRSYTYISGYSLVELLVSVTIFLCLSSLVIPSFSSINNRRAVSLKVWEIKRTLEYARSLAVTQNKFITVCVATEDYRCVKQHGSRLLVFDDQYTDYQWVPEEPLYRDVKLGNAAVKLSVSGRSYVRFDGSGASRGSGNFLVCIPGAEGFGRQVIFFYSGRIRLSKDSNRDGYDDKSGSSILCPKQL